jgi:dihydrofolate reductase
MIDCKGRKEGLNCTKWGFATEKCDFCGAEEKAQFIIMDKTCGDMRKVSGPRSFPLSISSVVAVTPTWGIGCRNTVPWAIENIRLPKDLQYFRRCTTETEDPAKINAVIMGRLTWESIPEANRPLKDRINIVLTERPLDAIFPSNRCNLFRNTDTQHIYVAKSFNEALQLITDSSWGSWVEKAVVVGGAQLFEEALFHPQFHCLHLSQLLHRDFLCDTFLTSKTIEYLQKVNLDEYVVEERIEESGVEYR